MYQKKIIGLWYKLKKKNNKKIRKIKNKIMEKNIMKVNKSNYKNKLIIFWMIKKIFI